MNRLLWLAFAAVTLAPSPAAAQENPIKAVAALEDEWAAAFNRKDYKAIEKLLADDYMFVSEDGKLYDKPGYMAMIRALPGLGTGAHNEKMQGKEYGNTVVINGIFVNTSASGTERSYWTDTWRKMGSEWKCVAGQATRIK
ncbi:MAG TPA: nuclear transport factor 2 family protein [Gemmatimonadales bacterium]